MSRPAVSELAPVEPSANVEQVEEVSADVSPELIRRVVFECNSTGSELANGIVVNLNNSGQIFTPSMAADLTAEEKAAFESRDFTQGIVTSMTLKSVHSSCPETVTVGMNLFANSANVANSKGWLYAQEVSDLSDNHAHQNDGYSNVATILPHERNRPNEVVYHPEGLMNSRWIKQYGGYTLDKLHEGITRFKGKDYCYVPDNHVVVSIIKNNWEQLGINLQSEAVREGEFMKVSKNIVDNCINQLYSNVISQIPYTKFSDLGARFQANTEGSAMYKVVCEMEVKYRFP